MILKFERILHAAFWITSNRRKINEQEKSISIRCEQGTKENNGLNVWLGRFAMVGFATAITVEISTGKGLLEFQTDSQNPLDDFLMLPCTFFDFFPPSTRVARLYKIPITSFALQNFGFTAPIPTLALAATALVGVLTAFFIFQSASRD
ncbi:hypothetical protein ZIOFF_030866 [Zingiber officinale]|uniref:Uncharacterized protein n=1 Tax=Zingiber officinale TaxID=94328 RepID=A0A8J5GTZ3_ZINOF|nr:hypothetical protein ZIOFF_030866 [Zingiber officinale]